MYTFDDYLKLSRPTKALATRFWVASIQVHLGAKSCCEIKKWLQTPQESESCETDWLNKSSRFFNLKMNGQPVVRVNTVDDIDRRIGTDFGFKALLCHPLWQLIDNCQPTIQSVNEVLSNLPAHYVNILFKEDGFGNLIRKPSLSKKVIRSLIKKTDIHAFTWLIARCLQDTAMDGETLDMNQLEAIKYLLKLANMAPFNAIAIDFYRHINDQFWPLYFDKPLNVYHYIWPVIAPNGQRCYLPMRLLAEDSLKIEKAIDLYKRLHERACLIGLVPRTQIGEAEFYAFICHTEMQPLIDILFDCDQPPTTLTELKHQIFQRTLFKSAQSKQHSDHL